MFKDRIVEAARAGYSGLAVQTPEVARAEGELLQAARELGRGFARWTCTQGWLRADISEGSIRFLDESGRTEGSPSGGVEGVLSLLTAPNGTVNVMHVFPEMLRDPNTRQAFRDVLAPARERRQVIVLVGTFEVPADLDKEFSSVEFDLPTREQLEAIARSLCEDSDMDVPENGTLARVVDGALGLTDLEAQNAFALSLVRNGTLDVDSVIETKKEIVRRSGILEYVESQESLATVGGLDVLKDWLISRAAGFTPKARAFGLTPPKGMLLAGIPGCGKSLVAKAISAAWGLPLLFLDMGRVFGSLVGQSERQLRDALKTAEALAPCILFIDEFEKAVGGTGGTSTDGGTTQRVMGSFLTWMQDRPADKPVFVVATANNVSLLPPEMLRKGRWDEVWAVLLPTAEERKRIFDVHLAKMGRPTLKVDQDVLASVSDGFTGSEIEEAVRDGLWTAFGEDRELQMQDLVNSCRRTIPLSRGPMREAIQAMAEDARFRKASRDADSDAPGKPRGTRRIDV